MKRKTTLLVLSIIVLLTGVVLLGLYSSCTEGPGKPPKDPSIENPSKTKEHQPQPLNITLFLDLSDRLTRNLTPSQKDRDTAIILNIARKFQERCVADQIIRTKNSMQVLFYPTPSDPTIANLAETMRIDCSKMDAAKKREKLINLPNDYTCSLKSIYDLTIRQQNWIGCDIWGFFNNGEAKKKCMRVGYRNVIVILTDGYVFHTANRQRKDSAYSYILPETLEDPNSTLIPSREKYPNLEVLMLEINLYRAEHRDPMMKILKDWFADMEVKFDANETDLPSTINPIVDSFIGW